MRDIVVKLATKAVADAGTQYEMHRRPDRQNALRLAVVTSSDLGVAFTTLNIEYSDLAVAADASTGFVARAVARTIRELDEYTTKTTNK